MRKLTKIIFFLLLCVNAYAGDIWSKEREKAKAMITQEKLAREISFLADSICQGRASGTKGGVEAAVWVQRKFEEAGLISMSDSWSHGFVVKDSLMGRNVIGMLAGSKSIPCDRYVIVGAHYDHIGELSGKMYPGADANASVLTLPSFKAAFNSFSARLALCKTLLTGSASGAGNKSNFIYICYSFRNDDFLKCFRQFLPNKCKCH